MTRYVLGLCFNTASTELAMIKKRRGPEGVKGFWNGVGGHVENSDATYHDAIQREFEEETGVLVGAMDWNHIVTLEGEDWVMEVFATWTDLVYKVRTMTDEAVDIFSVDVLRKQQIPCVSNIPFLISAAVDAPHLKKPFSFIAA